METEHDSRVLAFASGDLTTQHHYGNNSNDEVAMDIRGRKHVDTDDNIDGVYLLRDHTRSLHTVFPMPGKSSADTLRKSLQDHLFNGTITDEYGCVKPITHVVDNYLPNIQAELWLNKLESDMDVPPHFPVSERLQNCDLPIQTQYEVRPSPPCEYSVANETLLFSRHTAFITELLQCKSSQLYHDPFIIICSEPHLHTPEGTDERLRVPYLPNEFN
jgi:hypothetical protein